MFLVKSNLTFSKYDDWFESTRNLIPSTSVIVSLGLDDSSRANCNLGPPHPKPI